MSNMLVSGLFTILITTISVSPETASSYIIEGTKFDAEFLQPIGKLKDLGVIVLGGSEGGIPRRLAHVFAEEGFPTLALGYFKTDQTPEFLETIPLEYFDAPIKWFKSRPEVIGRKIVVIGGSKGGELALLLASMRPEIGGVIAIVPSAVVFQGISQSFWPPQSSWCYRSKPLPFVLYDTDYFFAHKVEITEGYLRGYYEASLKQTEAVEHARIPVENINGPILLLSAEDDRIWPSARMCEMICNRLKEKGFGHLYDHISYKNAGHTLNEQHMMGGTEDGNKEARINSKLKMMEFLNNLSISDSDSSVTK